MRISDWSSDVCSSDLDGEASLRPRGAWHAYEAADGGARRLTLVKKQLGGGLDAGVHVEAVMAVEVFEVAGLAEAVETERADLAAGDDRQSAVEGQRVCVRVDLGGTRFVQNKKSS